MKRMCFLVRYADFECADDDIDTMTKQRYSLGGLRLAWTSITQMLAIGTLLVKR